MGNFKKKNSVVIALIFLLSFLVACTSIEGGNDSITQETITSKISEEESSLYESSITKEDNEQTTTSNETTTNDSVNLSTIPEYSGTAYVVLDNNQPRFSDEEKLRTDAFEIYSNLDSLGRCGLAYANICKELMPTTKRGDIGQIRPSGWHTVKYNDLIDGNYLYNRCHLIAYQLAGENANEKNLITGTRYLNVVGMLPFENKVDDYVDSTGNHVLYRVTPIFDGNNLVASGVQMEAWSVEDGGKGVCFNVYCYNVQPYIGIDYATGDSWALQDSTVAQNSSSNKSSDSSSNSSSNSSSDSSSNSSSSSSSNNGTTYSLVINSNTKKIHLANCSSVSKMNESNKIYDTATVQSWIDKGYSPCKNCLSGY